MNQTGFRCKQCGNCCINLDAHCSTVSECDIRMWEENGRKDILEWVDKIEAGGVVLSYDIWINPKTGEDVESCPWLRRAHERDRYTCIIHDQKPAVCREYPLNRNQALEHGCKGYE